MNQKRNNSTELLISLSSVSHSFFRSFCAWDVLQSFVGTFDRSHKLSFARSFAR